MKTLGIYYSKTGVTRDVMNQIQNAITMDVYDIKSQPTSTLNDYQRIIVGTPVYIGMFPSKIKKYLKQNADKLINKELYLYTVGGEEPTDYQALFELSKVDLTLYHHIKKIVYCGGEFRFEKLSFFPRVLLKMVSKHKQKHSASETLPSLNQEAIESLIKVLS